MTNLEEKIHKNGKGSSIFKKITQFEKSSSILQMNLIDFEKKITDFEKKKFINFGKKFIDFENKSLILKKVHKF